MIAYVIETPNYLANPQWLAAAYGDVKMPTYDYLEQQVLLVFEVANVPEDIIGIPYTIAEAQDLVQSIEWVGPPLPADPE